MITRFYYGVYLFYHRISGGAGTSQILKYVQQLFI